MSEPPEDTLHNKRIHRGSNAVRTISLDIPEEFAAVLATAVREKSVQSGMHGFGCLANQLAGFSQKLNEEVPSYLRGFPAAGLAQAFKAHDDGWEIVIVEGDECSGIAICGFSPDGERELVLARRSTPKDASREGLIAALEDFFERRSKNTQNDDGNE